MHAGSELSPLIGLLYLILKHPRRCLLFLCPLYKADERDVQYMTPSQLTPEPKLLNTIRQWHEKHPESPKKD